MSRFAFMHRLMPKHVYAPLGDGVKETANVTAQHVEPEWTGEGEGTGNKVSEEEVNQWYDDRKRVDPRAGLRFWQRDPRPQVPLNRVFIWVMIIVWMVSVLVIFVPAAILAIFRDHLKLSEKFLQDLGSPWVVIVLGFLKESVGAAYVLCVFLRPDIVWLAAIFFFGYVFAGMLFGLLLALAIPTWYTLTSLIVTGVLFLGAFILAGVVGWLAGRFLVEHERLDRYRQWLDGSKSILTICFAVLSTVIVIQAFFGFNSTKHKSVALFMLMLCLLVVFFIRSLQVHIQPAEEWTVQTLQWKLYSLLSLTTNFHFTFSAFGPSIGVVDYNTLSTQPFSASISGPYGENGDTVTPTVDVGLGGVRVGDGVIFRVDNGVVGRPRALLPMKTRLRDRELRTMARESPQKKQAITYSSSDDD